ncbi:GTP cyclohydrolase I [Sulfodiicoccus acidiphilus]|nr:GTP cyclohydrolase I [Sulfodiicoccus acidiphilus]
MEQPQLDQQEVVQAIAKRIREVLELLGEDPNREGLAETPARVARALLEMTEGMRTEMPEVKVFSLREENSTYGEDEIVVARNVNFSSLCEHHVLPFFGKVDVAYVVGKEGYVAGFSKLSRLVNHFASRLQLQERLANQIADSLMQSDVKPKGVMVIIRGVHMCAYVRGVKDREADLVTMVTRGVMKTSSTVRNQAFRLLETQKVGLF